MATSPTAAAAVRLQAGGGGGLGGALRRRRTGLGFGVDRAITSPETTVSPSPLMISTSTPPSGRRQFENDLVGLDVDQVFVARNGLAFLLVPGNQRRLRRRTRTAAEL
jgi:hypothetical protein